MAENTVLENVEVTEEVMEEVTEAAVETAKGIDLKKVGIGAAVAGGLLALGGGAYALLKHFANKE